MRMIRPNELINSIVSCSIEEPSVGEVAWNSGTTYPAGTQVIRTTTHRKYLSIASGNVGHDPATDVTSSWWVDSGPTNRFAMFDKSVGTAATAPSTITIVLAPGSIDAVALLDVRCDSIRVQMTNSGSTVYDQTVNMSSAETITNWYSYFFDPIEKKTLAVFLNLPSYAGCIVTITVTSSDSAIVGTCIAGRVFRIGDTEYGAEVGIIDYSKKDRDEFGTVSVVERGYSSTMKAQVMCHTGAVDEIRRQLAMARATPILWIGSLRYQSLIVYGFVKDFSVSIAYEKVTYCNLQVEGLI